ncbi:MAG: 5'-methylthioadenosine/adenosylhomocysteine nucleosidase [Candidatus Izemoplasmatales bacterium]|jgi:adenosylhomocysteine nucleosidase
MIAIIGAMDLEIQHLLEDLQETRRVNFADKVAYIGQLDGKDVVIALSGVGKVNAAMTTSVLCHEFPLQCIINIGVAGGVNAAKVGDIVLAEGLAYFDVSLNGIDDVPYGQMGSDPLIVRADEGMLHRGENLLETLGYSYLKGLVVSGDTFVTELNTLEKIQQVLSQIVACEMEGMAIALTAYKYRIPFLSIRGISDVVGSTNQQKTYQTILKEVAEKTAGFARAFIKDV